MPPELAVTLEKDESAVEVWPCMKDAVALFFAMSTQWRWVGSMAGAMRTGLDYTPLPAVAGSLGIAVTADVLGDLRTMEHEAVKEWGRK